jgi:hypothetical protein
MALTGIFDALGICLPAPLRTNCPMHGWQALDQSYDIDRSAIVGRCPVENCTFTLTLLTDTARAAAERDAHGNQG